MICLAYLSTARAVPTDQEIDAILEVSRRNNTAAGVTGMLSHFDGSFLQFLEGEVEAVEQTFRRISADGRHHNLLEIYRKPILARGFPDWSMALARPDKVTSEQRAFTKGLRSVELDGGSEHLRILRPFLDQFRAWMR